MKQKVVAEEWPYEGYLKLASEDGRPDVKRVKMQGLKGNKKKKNPKKKKGWLGGGGGRKRKAAPSKRKGIPRKLRA